jgi:hypothetical protein
MRAHRRSKTYLGCSLATIFLKVADSVVWAEIGERRFGHVDYSLFYHCSVGIFSSVETSVSINSSGVGHSDDHAKPLTQLSIDY